MASGTSNRQTKALAASVRDAVREAGFGKPRIEGEENGEWIIVDCGAAVAHIMQPAIRQYYHLEEIWGEKPVRLKFGAAKPVSDRLVRRPRPFPRQEGARPSLRRASAAKTAIREAEQAAKAAKPSTRKPAAKKTAAGKSPARKAVASKTPIKTVVAGKPAAKKPAAKKAARKTTASRSK